MLITSKRKMNSYVNSESIVPVFTVFYRTVAFNLSTLWSMIGIRKKLW